MYLNFVDSTELKPMISINIICGKCKNTLIKIFCLLNIEIIILLMTIIETIIKYSELIIANTVDKANTINNSETNPMNLNGFNLNPG